MKKQMFNSFITKGGAALSLALAVCAFSACSSSDDANDNPNPGTTDPDVTTETVTVNNNVDVSSRVTIESTGAKIATRSNTASDIAKIATLGSYSDGTNTLSATGVDQAGSNVMVSYHWNGTDDDISGAIESVNYNTTDGITVKSQMLTNTTGVDNREFNNVLVSGNKAYFVGASNKKGGIVASIAISDNKFDEAGVLSVARTTGWYNLGNGKDGVHAADVNSIAACSDGSLLIASTAGFESFSTALASTSNYIFATALPAWKTYHAKSVSVSGTNAAAIIVDSAETSKARLVTWTVGNFTSMKSIEIGTTALTPTKGKFTVKLDGTTAYVTMGTQGVMAYDISGETIAAKTGWEQFVLTSTNPSYPATANGLDVDDDYVYVAYGANGIYMLNKTNGAEIAHFNSSNLKWDGNGTTPTMASANAIKVVNGYIYVAQGKDGLVVYKYK